jgi:hypothetical protein
MNNQTDYQWEISSGLWSEQDVQEFMDSFTNEQTLTEFLKQ